MKNSRWATLVVVIVLALWMLSGKFKKSDSDSTTESLSVAENQPMAVQITTADNILMAREIELQGQLEPVRQLQLKAQTSGVVQEIFIKKGARVETSEPLIQLEPGGRGNTLAEAEALVKTARSEQAAAKALREQRLQSQLQLEQADAALEAALARLASISLEIDYTTITAPFAGIVNEIPIEQGTLLQRGDVVAELIDSSAFKVNAQAAQTSLAELQIGQSVTASLITGQTLNGKLTYISAIADARSRTFAVEALVENPAQSIAAGVSATLSVPVEQIEATFVSPSVLSLGSEGQLGIKAVDANDLVVFIPVSLVSTTLDGAWVSGIDSGTRIITLGQGFVNPGDTVRPQPDEDA